MLKLKCMCTQIGKYRVLATRRPPCHFSNSTVLKYNVTAKLISWLEIKITEDKTRRWILNIFKGFG